MPHIIWKGAVSFGLVHVPVKLYPATTHTAVGFDLLDKRSLDPIGYRKINKTTGKEVSGNDIVRGIEYSKGDYVVLSDEEIRSANVESTQTVDILAFVDAPEISFLYLDTPYFLEPDKGGSKVYALLREALKRTGKIGIANVVMHGKQHLAALVPAGPVLALNTLRWAADVRDVAELTLPDKDLKAAGVSPKELDMALRLVEDMAEPWDPAQYRDTFHDDIMALVKRKVESGKTRQVETPSLPSAPRRNNVVDLSDLLRRSLGARGKAEEKDTGKVTEAAKAASKAAPKASKKSAAKSRKKSEGDDAASAGATSRTAVKRKRAA